MSIILCSFTEKKDTLKTQSLAVILEGIRHLFMDYRRKLEDLNADVGIFICTRQTYLMFTSIIK